MAGTRTRISVLALALLLSLNLTEAGVSFTRWGRTQCPTGSQTLYKGYMAGSHYLPYADGANYLCVAQEPQFVRGTAGLASGGTAAIFGVELEYFPNNIGGSPLLTDNVPDKTLHNQDLPCVRCYVADSTDMLIIPGRHDCYNSGYDLQYKGFMVAQAHTNTRQPSEYICLDEAPEGRVGGTGDDNQSVVYPVEVVCGSLPCNPYINGMELTCAVCTY